MRVAHALLMSVSLLAPAWGQSVTVSASPETIYIEAGPHLQELNFDLRLQSSADREFLITGIELTVLDGAGQVVRREFVDRNSRRHAELLPERRLGPNGSMLVFNPFHTFAADQPLHELRYRLTLQGPDQGVEHADVTVRPVRYLPRTRFIPPLRGRMLIWDGHDYSSHHRRTDFSVPVFGLENQYHSNFQRYGFDFVLVDDSGQMSRRPLQTTEDYYRHDPARNADYYGFGADVLATAAGTVVELHDGEADDLRFDPRLLATRETAYGGNYVIIDHGHGEFSWYGHLRQNSVRVKAGQKVRQGEVIGAVGASGSSLFPHLHYELRSGPGARRAEGLPSYFTGFRRASHHERVSRPTPLNTGDLIEVR